MISQVRPTASAADSSESKEASKSYFLMSVRKFATETTLHGFRNVTDSDSSTLRRILWLFVILGCTGLCAQQFYQRIDRFVSQPTSVDMDIIYVNKMTFPKVVFCNINSFNILKADYFTYKIATQIVAAKYNIDNNTIQKIKEVDEMTKNSTGSYNNLTENYDKHRRLLSDMLISCEFRGETCGERNFSKVITDYGICYQFIGNEGPLEVTNPGSRNGLFMTINIEHYAYLANSRKSAGILLSATDEADVPLMNSRSISIPVGTETLVALDLTKVELIELSEGGCMTKSLKNYKQYSKSACWLECQLETIVEHCGCKDSYFPGNATLCRVADFYSCALPYSENFTKSPKANECDCPPACTDYVYSPKMTYAPFSKPNALEMGRNLTNKKLLYDYIRGSDLSERNLQTPKFLADLAALTQLAPYFQNFVDALLPNYPILNDLHITLLLAERLAVSESLSSMALNDSISSAQIQITKLITILKQTGIEKWFLALDILIGVLTELGSRYAFDGARYDTNSSDGLSKTSACLWLSENTTATVREIVNSANSTITQIRPLNHTAQDSLWETAIVNITQLLQTLEKTAANLQSEGQAYVKYGLDPLNSYINANVGKISAVTLDEDFIRENILSVDIFFSEMRYMSIKKELSDSPLSLVCDLGGVFGLFLGASIMSLYEFVDVLLHLLGLKLNTK